VKVNCGGLKIMAEAEKILGGWKNCDESFSIWGLLHCVADTCVKDTCKNFFKRLILLNQ